MTKDRYWRGFKQEYVDIYSVTSLSSPPFASTSFCELALSKQLIHQAVAIINMNALCHHITSPNFFPPQTPLHLAVITNQADVCQRLLVSGCDPTLVDDSGDTPLHIACRHGDLLCFSVLTQNCQPEHLHTVMAACNYHGKIVVREQCFFPELMWFWLFPPLNI